MLADLTSFFEDVDVLLAELRVGIAGVVLVDELRETQSTGHAGGPAADDDNVGGHLGAVDAFERFAKDKHSFEFQVSSFECSIRRLRPGFARAAIQSSHSASDALPPFPVPVS